LVARAGADPVPDRHRPHVSEPLGDHPHRIELGELPLRHALIVRRRASRNTATLHPNPYRSLTFPIRSRAPMAVSTPDLARVPDRGPWSGRQRWPGSGMDLGGASRRPARRGVWFV